jgi:phosphatidate phosphatase PAH1
MLKESVNSVASVTSAVLPTMSGAIDIVVVRQQDGTFRCSPFYGEFFFCDSGFVCSGSVQEVSVSFILYAV